MEKQVKIFLLFSILFGIIISFLIPATRVPDEHTHFSNMINAFGLPEEYINQYYKAQDESKIYVLSDGNLPREERHFKKAQYFSAFGSKNTISFGFTGKINPIGIIRYFPCFVGFLLGITIKLPLLYCLHLAELSALAFYVLMGVLTLKTAPIKKDFFLYILLIPTAMQLGASLNYDCLLISLSLFLTAYIFKLSFEKEVIGYRELSVVLLITLLLFVIKLPYGLLGLLIFSIPLTKIYLPVQIGDKKIDLVNIFKKIRFFLLISVVILGIIGVFITNFETTKVIAASILNPFTTIKLVIVSFLNLSYAYFMGSFFGIGNYEIIPDFFPVLVLFIILLMSLLYTEDLTNIKTIKKSFRFALVIIPIFIIALAFISQILWTMNLNGVDKSVDIFAYRDYIKTIEYIEGVQGRYFIPILPAFLIGIVGSEHISCSPKKFRIIQTGFIILNFLYYINMGYQAYWINS